MILAVLRFFSTKLTFSKKILSGIESECQTGWIEMRPSILLGLIWVQTVAKDYQQRAKSSLANKMLISQSIHLAATM